MIKLTEKEEKELKVAIKGLTDIWIKYNKKNLPWHFRLRHWIRRKFK